MAWDEVIAALAAAGWQARVVPVARLDDVKARLVDIITAPSTRILRRTC